MPAEIKKEIQLEIAHVLFIDIVGYSKLSINDQRAAIDELTQVVRASVQFQSAEAAARLIKIPTGDGMALVFYKSPEEPVKCALEISRALKEHPRIQLRMGVHSGPVSGVIDVNGQANLAGAGLNVAQRVMGCGDAGHILLSRHVAEDLEGYEQWRLLLHDLGFCAVKHGVKLQVVNLCTDGAGNRALPAKLRAQRQGVARTRWILLATSLALLAVVVAAFVAVSRRAARSSSTAPAKSIAVLPFVDMSEKKDEEYFADGLSEELIGMLTTVPELKVPARTSSFYFQGKQTTIADIAKALGVAHVLEGSVRKSGNTLRITAQLIRVDNGYHVWSETYDRKLDDIFQVQDEIAGAVVKALKVSLLEGDMPKATRTANQEAYALYLQGRSLHYRGTHADAQKAIRYMEQALKLDPTYAPAWFGLADSLVYDYVYFGGSYQDVHARVRAAAETALRLDPKLSEAHLAMGRVLGELEWDWAAADAEFKRTLELDPNNVLALWCASGYALIGDRLDEALKLIQNAAARDAVGYGVYTGIGDVQIRRGRLAEAEAAYRKATELNATAAGTHMWLGFVLLARGESKAALAVMEQETDEGYRQYGLALAFGALGQQSDADRALAALETNYADSRPGHIASVYACRQQLDRAFGWLDRAYRQRDGWLPLIKADPCVKNLEPDPRYKALLRKLKLPE